MTLMNGMVEPQRAHLWSDTRWMDPHSGRAIAYGPKGFTCSLTPAAVLTTAVGGNPYKIPEFVAARMPMTLGSVLEACEDAAREFVKVQPEVASVRLLIGGWCWEREEARLFVVVSDPVEPFAAFTATEVAYFIGSAASHPKVAEALAGGHTPATFEAIAEIQRESPECPDRGGFAPMLGIGGELVHHVVTRDGVTSSTVKVWDAPELSDQALVVGGERLAFAG